MTYGLLLLTLFVRRKERNEWMARSGSCLIRRERNQKRKKEKEKRREEEMREKGKKWESELSVNNYSQLDQFLWVLEVTIQSWIPLSNYHKKWHSISCSIDDSIHSPHFWSRPLSHPSLILLFSLPLSLFSLFRSLFTNSFSSAFFFFFFFSAFLQNSLLPRNEWFIYLHSLTRINQVFTMMDNDDSHSLSLSLLLSHFRSLTLNLSLSLLLLTSLHFLTSCWSSTTTQIKRGINLHLVALSWPSTQEERMKHTFQQGLNSLNEFNCLFLWWIGSYVGSLISCLDSNCWRWGWREAERKNIWKMKIDIRLVSSLSFPSFLLFPFLRFFSFPSSVSSLSFPSFFLFPFTSLLRIFAFSFNPWFDLKRKKLNEWRIASVGSC